MIIRAPSLLNRQAAERAKDIKQNAMDGSRGRVASLRAEPSQEVDELARVVIGALIEVHRKLGPGFLEGVYEEAACIEFDKRDIPYDRQVIVAIKYDGRVVGEGRIDLLVGKKLIVELKAVDALAPIHQAQLMSYLRMTKLELGLLVNFNVPVLKYGIKRVVLTH